MKSAGKARSNGLYRHIRTSKEIIRNLLNDSFKSSKLSPLARPLFIWLAPLTVVISHLSEFSVTASMVGMIQLPFSTPATMSP